MPMKAALLVVDMQRLFLDHQKDALNVPNTCEYINCVRDLFRRQEQVIVYIKDIESRTADNESQLDFVNELQIAPSDHIIEKLHGNAFWETSLHKDLQKAGVNFVMVPGFSAEHCVLATYLGALERGYKTAILQQGVTSVNPAAIQELYRDRHMVSYPVLEAIWSGG